MKNYKILIVWIVSLLLLTTGCQQSLRKPVQLSVKKTGLNNYPYLLYLPDGYSIDNKKKWPLIVYLHGASLRGSSLNKLNKYGIPHLIENGKKFQFIVVSPQCPSKKRWYTDKWFENLYAEITDKYRVDTSRVYLTGLSMGGEGAWYLAVNHTNIFAAVAPICGRTTRNKQIHQKAYKLKKLPLWVFHGAQDAIVNVRESNVMVKLLQDNGSNVKYTKYPFADHGDTHWRTYKNDELYEWFLQNKKN